MEAELLDVLSTVMVNDEVSQHEVTARMIFTTGGKQYKGTLRFHLKTKEAKLSVEGNVDMNTGLGEGINRHPANFRAVVVPLLQNFAEGLTA